MPQFEEGLFARFAGKSVLLDSNLLLIFLCGSLGAQVFTRFKRVKDYSMDDYELLLRFVGCFSVLLTTPHILTEVNNLANSLPEWVKPDWYENFSSLIASQDQLPGLREHWDPAIELSQMPQFAAFGITDTALTRLSSEALIVTEDYRLSGSLASCGIDVLNFGDLRKLRRLLWTR